MTPILDRIAAGGDLLAMSADLRALGSVQSALVADSVAFVALDASGMMGPADPVAVELAAMWSQPDPDPIGKLKALGDAANEAMVDASAALTHWPTSAAHTWAAYLCASGNAAALMLAMGLQG